MDADHILVLDDKPATDIIAARTAEVAAKVQANNATRKEARAATGSKEKSDAAVAKASATSAESAAKATYDGLVAAALVAHAVQGTPAEIDHDAGQGHLVCRTVPLVKLPGLLHVERKRIAMSDSDCDAFAASYGASSVAELEAFDLGRQVRAYEAAHPSLFVLGDPPPVDPAYEGLKAALKAKGEVIATEEAKQAALVAPYLKGEPERYYEGVSIATGEIVIGDRPLDGAKPVEGGAVDLGGKG